MSGTQMYQSNQQTDDLSGLVSQYAPLVKRIAEKIKYKCPPSIELDDLMQHGIIGLLQAYNDFNPSKGASFSTYASIKIRYAIYEGLRQSTGITREISQNIKKINAIIEQMDQDNQPLKHQKIAETLGISSEQYSIMRNEIAAHKMLSMEEIYENQITVESSQGKPYDETLTTEISEQIKALLSTLPKREQIILALYYNELLTFKEIADILHLTEARVSQIHRQLRTKLKARIPEIEDFLE
ncbi:FliA/WhiG family RNA polymerase sigma factor [Legionella israelensis]|uniref:sigma-70 family RNA polymerase sigma factor n=1 Tax=Legionella israelensis TaxID=454 RepID=UPI00117C9767|nr:RNA polymerase sigma factor FliA [Legionella israelensis]QDP73467.1 FliA/WhiG family RNA polymerase sigma factor [Legionella israelensis]